MHIKVGYQIFTFDGYLTAKCRYPWRSLGWKFALQPSWTGLNTGTPTYKGYLAT